MKYELAATGRFKKDLKSIIKRGYDVEFLNAVVSVLISGEQLADKYKDHSLIGNWANYRECHITPDWILIYKIEDNLLVLTLTRTGTHADLF